MKSHTVSIPGFIVAEKAESWQRGDAHIIDGMAFRFTVYDSGEHIAPHMLTFTIPAGWDGTTQQIEALEEKREKATAAYQAMVTDINRQISELKCLEMAA